MFDCLIFEMLFIKELNHKLNTQKDSIRAKLFTDGLNGGGGGGGV